MSVRPPLVETLTDVTLADEDTNSILTDNAKSAIQGNVGNTSYTTWWATLRKWRHLMSNSGSVVPESYCRSAGDMT